MEDQVKGKTEELIHTLLDSEEYRTFDIYRRLLDETPELKERVQTFRKARIEASFSGKTGKEISSLLMSQYSDILNNTVAANYLNSELLVCKKIPGINEALVNSVQLELDFL